MNEQIQPNQYREMSRDEMMISNAKQAAMAEQRRIDATVAKQAADPWVHRSDGMRCRTCIWFVSKEPQALTVTVKSHEVGRCRRHAPTMGGYPVVYMTDWCGDHRLDENKI
jgi:hypothetical protein